MNGFSLLLVLATVGTTVGVETDATGQASYTIRIESVLIDQLRQGQVVEQSVALADRRIKRFRVMVGDTSARPPTFNARADSSSLVEYEAVQLENNEVEMWVQVSPERLLTLATRPIEGQVPAEIQQIHRFKIFVGVNELPRQQQTNAAANDSRSPYILADNGGLAQTGATSNPTRPSATTSSRNGGFQTGSPTFNPGFGSSTTAPPLANSNTRTTDTRIGWRNGPDPSTISPPPPTDRLGTQVLTAPTFNDGHYNAPAGARLNEQYQPTYNNTAAPQYNSTPTYDRNAPTYGANQYSYGNSSNPQTNGFPAQPSQPQYNQNQYSANGFGQPQATIAARPDTQYIQPPAAAIAASPQPTIQTVAPAAVTVTTPTVTASSTKVVDETPKSSTPLILTTLALFTSLGVNAYLGWLAWSFFWRYRDAVNDSARARSYNAPGRQAA